MNAPQALEQMFPLQVGDTELLRSLPGVYLHGTLQGNPITPLGLGILSFLGPVSCLLQSPGCGNLTRELVQGLVFPPEYQLHEVKA